MEKQKKDKFFNQIMDSIKNRWKSCTPKENTADIFFWIGILCEFLVSFSGYCFGYYKEPVIIVVGMLCFSITILLTMDLKRDWIVFGICAVFGLLNYYFQREALILRILLMLLAGRNQKANSILKFFFWGTFVAMIYTGIIAGLGFHNSVSISAVFRNEEEVRYCFGFYHPNGFAFFLFRVLVLGLYCYGEKLKWWGYLITAIVSLSFMKLANSKMGLAAIAITLLVTIFLHYLKNKKWAARIVWIAGSLILFAEQFIVMGSMYFVDLLDRIYIGKMSIWYNIALVTSGRTQAIHETAQEYQFHLFGLKKFEHATEVGYFNALYNQGIIFIILYLVLVTWFLYKMYKEHNSMGMMLIIAISIYAFSEAFLPYANKNIIWLLMVGNLSWLDGRIKNRQNINSK